MKICTKLRWSDTREQAEIMQTIFNMDLEDLICYKMNKETECKKECRNTNQCKWQFTTAYIETFTWLLQQDEKFLERGILQNE